MSGPALTILQGDALTMLRGLPDESVQCCVTSPPYWGLRDYGHAGQIGLEDTPAQYVERMVEVFHEVKRVLKDDGTLWLNLGDSYAGSGRGKGSSSAGPTHGQKMGSADGDEGHTKYVPPPKGSCLPAGMHETARAEGAVGRAWVKPPGGFKCKDLIGIPWRVAFALQADGWYLRSDIIWAKPNPMPESITDRPTKSHEYVFLLAKSERYFYDYEGAAEPVVWNSHPSGNGFAGRQGGSDHLPMSGGEGSEYKWTPKPAHGSVAARKLRVTDCHKSQATKERNGFRAAKPGEEFSDAQMGSATRNRRTVWTVPTQAYHEAHFATFPKKLIEPMIRAGCPTGGVVLDPFGGSGTTGQVALELGRSAILCELNPAYCELIRQRCNVTPGLAFA